MFRAQQGRTRSDHKVVLYNYYVHIECSILRHHDIDYYFYPNDTQ